MCDDRDSRRIQQPIPTLPIQRGTAAFNDAHCERVVVVNARKCEISGKENRMRFGHGRGNFFYRNWKAPALGHCWLVSPGISCNLYQCRATHSYFSLVQFGWRSNNIRGQR